MNQQLKETFQFRRSYGHTATRALELARADIAAGKPRKHYPLIGGMRGGADFKIGSDSVFWCERPADYLRSLGFVDEMSDEGRMRGYCIDHKGWFLDDDFQDEVARGVVFQLPGKNGKPRYIGGVADPCNDGPAILSLEIFDDKTDAAHSADELARIYADNEKDYRRASNAGNHFVELGQEADSLRTRIIQLGAERRALRAKLSPLQFPAACKALADAIRHAYAGIVAAREERAELESNFGRDAAFLESIAEG